MEKKTEDFERDAQEEWEKQFFGQDMYKFSYKLPTINLSDDPEDIYTKSLFIIHLEMVKDLADLSGKEIAMLFAECYKIYEIEEKPNGIKGNMLANFCKVSLGQIALALKQAELLINELKDTDKKEIKGEDYCFIGLFLSSLFTYYMTIINAILIKNYVCKETLEIMRDKIDLFMREEFNILKALFKTVECFEALEPDQTIH